MTNRTRAHGSTLEEEVKLLELLQRSGAAISAKLDLQSVAQTIASLAAELSGARSGTLFYRQAGRDRGAPSRGEPGGHAFARVGDPRGAPLPTATVASGEVLFSGNLVADPQRKQVTLPPALPGDQPAVRSYLAVPVVTSSGDVLGGLVVGHPDPDVFTELTKRIVVGIAEQAAIAINNAQLYEATRQTSEERARLLDVERAARAALEKADLAKNEALASLSHELRAPLNAILGWSEVLLGRVAPESELARGLEVIARNARMQAQLIQDLLDKHRTAAAVPPTAGSAAPAAVLPAARPRRTDRVPISLAGMTILVIDDDNDARDLVKRILVDAAANVLTAASADEGLALLRHSRPDVVVSDIGMAMRDGYQFIRLVRMMSPADGGATPALALTALALAEDRTRALLAGFQDHLAKPVEAEQLLAAIHRLARPA